MIPARAAVLLFSRSSDSKVGGSWRLSTSERFRIGVPASSPAAIVGESCCRATAAGCRSRNRPVELASSVRMRGRVLIAVSSVGGPSEIDSWMNGLATSARAVNVVSSEPNIAAWTSATGATSAAVAPSVSMNRARPVRDELRLRVTGCSTSSTPGRRPSAELRLGPRPASASPNSRRFSCAAARVGSSKVLSTVSSSTGFGVAAVSGIVLPSSKPLSDLPMLISRYLSPSAERERTARVESTGIGSTSLSSFRSRRALVLPLPSDWGSIDSTIPDADAADPDLVAGHERVGVRHLSRDPVGGHEREAVVRVVREEDGEDHHHHGQRADHRRARRQARSPAPHRFAPRCW